MFTVKPLSFAVTGDAAVDQEYTRHVLFYFPFTAASLFSLGSACWGVRVCRYFVRFLFSAGALGLRMPGPNQLLTECGSSKYRDIYKNYMPRNAQKREGR